MQLQTQMNPNQVEILFEAALADLEKRGKFEELNNLRMNLREISTYNLEQIKKRFMNFY